MRPAFHIGILVLVLVPFEGLHAQQLLIDIDPGQSGPSVVEMLSSGDKVFITGQDGSLWVTDAAGSELKRIHAIHTSPATGVTTLNGIFPFGDNVFLRVDARDGRQYSMELWISDGTEMGTQRLWQGGIVGDYFVNPVQVGRWMFFRVRPTANTLALFKTDGTPEGTQEVLPLECCSSLQPMTGVNGRLIMSYRDPSTLRNSTISIDAESNEVVDLFPEGDDSGMILGANDSLAIVFRYDESLGFEPWTTDGTVAGTRFLIDVTPGPRGSDGVFVGRVGSYLLFRSNGLWSTAGTPETTHQLIEEAYINKYDIHYPSGVEAAGYWYLGASLSTGWGLWRTDGTPNGTHLVHQSVVQDPSAAIPHRFASLGQDVFFFQRDANFGEELWTSNGTQAGTRRLTDMQPGPSSSYSRGIVGTDMGIVFSVWPSVENSVVWFNGGTATSTRPVPFVRGESPGDSGFPDDIQNWSDDIVFTASNGEEGQEIWRSDGSRAGTRQISLGTPGPASIEPRIWGPFKEGLLTSTTNGLDVFDPDTGLFEPISRADSLPVWVYSARVWQDHALMLARDRTGTPEFWITDGSAQGTRQISGFREPRLTQRAAVVGRVNDRLVYSVEEPRRNTTLFATHSVTLETEVLASDIPTDGQRVRVIHQGDDRLVLSSDDGLMETDGTPAGTRAWSTAITEPIRYRASLESITLFAPNWPQTGELWRTDGTEQGTTSIKRLCPPQEGCDWINGMVTSGDYVFLEHESRGIWYSDGTSDGTKWLTNLPVNVDKATILAHNDEMVIFELRQRNDRKSYSRSLWQIDSSTPSARRLIETELWEAAALDDLSDGRILGDRFVFVASHTDTGRELFFVDLTNPRAVYTTEAATLPEFLSLSPAYPNPASNSAIIGFSLPRSQHVRIEVLNTLGRLIATRLDEMMPAGPHELAFDVSAYPAGAYFVRIQTEDKRATSTIIKAR